MAFGDKMEINDDCMEWEMEFGDILITLAVGVFTLACGMIADAFPWLRPFLVKFHTMLGVVAVQNTVIKAKSKETLTGCEHYQHASKSLRESRLAVLRGSFDEDLAVHRSIHGHDRGAAIGVWAGDLHNLGNWIEITNDKYHGRITLWLWAKECTSVTNASDPALLRASKLRQKGGNHSASGPAWAHLVDTSGKL